jgi:hypothetical protein
VKVAFLAIGGALAVQCGVLIGLGLWWVGLPLLVTDAATMVLVWKRL